MTPPFVCKTHANQELTHFCPIDLEFLCGKCATDHFDHKPIESDKTIIKEFLDLAKEKLTEMQTQINSNLELLGKLKNKEIIQN